MPRAIDGSYNLPAGTLVNAGDTILVSQHNPAMQDIATTLTSSLDRNGSGGMRAPLSMGGFPVKNMLPGVADDDAATVGQLSGAGRQVGEVMDFAGPTPPVGWLMCYGQAVNRTTYAALFAVIGTTYGTGDGATTFNVPDCRGRVSAGKDNMGGTAANRLTTQTGGVVGTTLGGVGGNQRHTLSASEMPVHNHSVNDPGHSHVYDAIRVGGGIASNSGYGQEAKLTQSSQTGVTIANAGGGAAHNNVQPTIIFNKLIYAGVV